VSVAAMNRDGACRCTLRLDGGDISLNPRGGISGILLNCCTQLVTGCWWAGLVMRCFVQGMDAGPTFVWHGGALSAYRWRDQ
jgi:hypothetical protein